MQSEKPEMGDGVGKWPSGISIVIPCYNSSKYLVRTLESVFAQSFLQSKNTADLWELILVDDGSTDGSDRIAAAWAERDNRVRFSRTEKNLGISRTRNRGIAVCRGEYVAIIDSDDVWLDPDKLSKQAAFLDNCPDHALVGTWTIQIDEQDRPLQCRRALDRLETQDHEIRRSILYRNSLAHSSIMFRRSAAVGAIQGQGGPYDQSLSTMEDHDLWLRMGARKDGPHKFAKLPIYATGYRVHKAGVTKARRRRVALDELKVILRQGHEYPGLYLGLMKGILRLLSRI